MLTIRRIELDNFVCFDNAVIEPSIDPDRPLTIVRAENGCGKTTLLRALRWGMYGNQSLPGDPDNRAQFSLHPADWHPDDQGIKTAVAIEFETDGSSRDDPQANSSNTVYQLTRSVTSIAHVPARPGDPDFRRINERTQLLERQPDGSWSRHDAGVDAVVAQLLPWGLRDFFVMDADEAADFVGGSENKVLSRQVVTAKTTDAVRALLGIDVFKSASKRVAKLGHKFGREATKAIGNADLDRQQSELDQLRDEAETISGKVTNGKRNASDIADRLDSARNSLESLIGSIAAREELKQRMMENRKRQDELTKQRAVAVGQLAGELEAIDLLGALAVREIRQVQAALQPLYDSNMIPMKHVGFVQKLLDGGTCVCGQDLSSEGEHRWHVEEMLDQSSGQQERANYLAQVLDAAIALGVHDGVEWELRCTNHAGSIADIDEKLRDVENAKRDIDAKLDSVDDEQVQVKRDEIKALETQRNKLNLDLASNEEDLTQTTARVGELDKKIGRQRKRLRAARDQEACRETADAIVEVLDRAYAAIQREQVKELADEMNRLFANMVANVADDEFDTLDRRKATLRMIAEVGLGSVDDSEGGFAIFALNSRARPMPATEINGASRRTLALAFVLALCRVSQTRAPLVADSLLNFMSGVVRSNTLRVTAMTASQPILLLTTSDLASQTEVETVDRFAGATYTLTGQWQHIEQGGDVMNQTDPRRVARICTCGPRQYCNVCERQGQADLPGWTQRTSRGHGP